MPHEQTFHFANKGAGLCGKGTWLRSSLHVEECVPAFKDAALPIWDDLYSSSVYKAPTGAEWVSRAGSLVFLVWTGVFLSRPSGASLCLALWAAHQGPLARRQVCGDEPRPPLKILSLLCVKFTDNLCLDFVKCQDPVHLPTVLCLVLSANKFYNI